MPSRSPPTTTRVYSRSLPSQKETSLAPLCWPEGSSGKMLAKDRPKLTHRRERERERERDQGKTARKHDEKENERSSATIEWNPLFGTRRREHGYQHSLTCCTARASGGWRTSGVPLILSQFSPPISCGEFRTANNFILHVHKPAA